MRLACADFSWPGLSHDLALDIIRELGCEGVLFGLIGDYSPVHVETVREDVPFWAGRIVERVHSHGLELADVFPIASMDLAALAVNDPDAGERERSDGFFRDMVDFTLRTGVDGLTILPGMPFAEESWDASFDRACDGLARRVDEARSAGLRLSVEPHHGSIVEKPDTTARLLEAVPGLELTLDYGHFTEQGIGDAEIEPLLERTRLIHLRPCRPGFVQSRVQDNTIDFDRIVDRLAELGFDGWLALEFVHDARPGCQDCDVIQEARILGAQVLERAGAARHSCPAYRGCERLRFYPALL
jgi:sugar phosphate isomerase/epimerase